MTIVKKKSVEIEFDSYRPGSAEAKEEWAKFSEQVPMEGANLLHERWFNSGVWHAYRALRQYLECNGGDPLMVIERFEQYALEACGAPIAELDFYMLAKICWQVEDDADLDALLDEMTI